MAKQKYSIEDMKKYALTKGGKCLSTKYSNPHKKLLWECSKGHQWEAIPNSVFKQGTWCRVCAGKEKLAIQHCKRLAKARGGECLSDVYENHKKKLRWKCLNGHTWEANMSNIQQGKWCPMCSSYLSERICRTYLEEVFKKPFPKTRSISWLKNSAGTPLELDGYCDELKLAFEHNGEHHYKKTRYYDSSKYDELKKDLCKKFGVILIEIPQLGILTKLEDLPGVIRKKLKHTVYCDVILPSIHLVNLNRAYNNDSLSDLRTIAKLKKRKTCIQSIFWYIPKIRVGMRLRT